MLRTLFRNRWWIVVGCVFGQLVGQGPFNVYAAGVFLKPIAAQLHFGRGLLASAMALGNIGGAFAAPFVGRLLDRRGIRATLLPCIALFAVATASRALLTPSHLVLFVLFALSGITGAGQMPMAYAKIITLHFNRDRGLALGIALAGTGLGTAVVPRISAFLLQNFGWRVGYLGAGATIMILGFIPISILFWEPISSAAGQAIQSKGTADRADIPGETVAQALRTYRFWAMNLAFFLGIMAINGSIFHIVALLTDRGFSLSAATATLGVSGLAMVVGRVFSGWCMDRVFATYIAIIFFFCPMVGITILLYGWAPATLGVVLLGLGIGAEFDMAAYLCGVHFGLRSFGSLHGIILFSITVGTALGAAFLGWFYQIQRTYHNGYLMFEALLAIAIVLLISLGRYRYPPVHRHREPEQVEAVAAR